MTEPLICCICVRSYTGFGNNAWPVNSERCCDDCNERVVIPARVAELRQQQAQATAWDAHAKANKLEL